MKRRLYLQLIVIATMVSSMSCSDYLEKAPGVDVTEDTIFSSREQLETFVAGTYYWGLLGDLPYWDMRDKSDCISDAATDEGEVAMTWYWTQGWNSGNMTPTHPMDNRFSSYWTALRRINTIIDRVDAAPFSDDAYKTQVRGEAKFLRAYNYMQLFIKYGGVPILKKRFELSDNFKVPRATIAEMVDFMVQDCNDAIKDLPSYKDYSSNLRGRATREAAMALKSRILLYAASPTFNTATPYMDFGQNNNLIIYGDYSEKRWKDAADAAKDAIDAALAAGFRLIDDQGVDKNYRYAWENADNDEIILAEKSHGACGPWHFPWGPSIPQSCSGFGGAISMTFNMLQKYEKKDGTPEIWDMNGGMDLMKKYKEIDPRFAQTAVYQGQKWNDVDKLVMDFTSADADLGTKDGVDKCIGGMLAHKPVPYSVSTKQPVIPNGIIFRVAELYLNYAEALNECSATPPEEAYAAIDKVRARSGMPSLPRNMSKTQFREKVRNERTIELAFEGHRLWDVRRWQIADEDGVMKGNMYGLKIYSIKGSTTEFRYLPYVFETRTFTPKMYRHPFPQSEIEKGYLIQNPGYN